MRRCLKASVFGMTSTLLLILIIIRAATPAGAAARFEFAHLLQFDAPVRRDGLPAPVSFRESESRGLLVEVWVNGAGPYTFALDTGAGATVLAPHVAGEARVIVERGAPIHVGGLSGMSAPVGQKAILRSLAVGFRENSLPGRGFAIVSTGLPSDIDGILDPTEAFWPLGYIIDIPQGELRAFDPRATPLRRNETLREGAIVPWLTDGSTRRPFVSLEGGRRALLDPGSGFGLAVNEGAARALGLMVTSGRDAAETRDIAGGRVLARRIKPATVHIGELELRGVPTDLLIRAERGAPILLGRDALRPFQLSFDPVNRLIRIQAQ